MAFLDVHHNIKHGEGEGAWEGLGQGAGGEQKET